MESTFVERVCDIDMEMRYVKGNLRLNRFLLVSMRLHKTNGLRL